VTKPHAQVLDDSDHAVVAAEFAGDRDQPGRATGYERQRPCQRRDVAVNAQQRPRDDAQEQRGYGDADDDRPFGTEVRRRRPGWTMVPM